MSHDEHREGFAHDLPAMQQRGMVRVLGRPMGRRGLFGLVGGGAAVATLAACGAAEETTGSTDASQRGGPPSGGGQVSQVGLEDGDIPEETNGPYPADGTNGVNVLTESGIVRQDIRSGFGDSTAVAEGVPLSIKLSVYNHEDGELTPYAGAAVYIWHCDREGNYSLYSDGLENENYLRGVQEVADDGTLEFTSIFPACYSGRWPHLHFEVYGSLDDATSASTKLRTSQIAFPEDVCSEVYENAEGYSASVENLAAVSLDDDNVFGDGHSLQLATLTGSVDAGYTLKLAVPV